MKIKFLSIFSVAVLALSSCSSSDFDENENNGQGNENNSANGVEMSDVEVKFGSSLGLNVKPYSLPLTRVNNDMWDNNDRIGVYMYHPTSTTTNKYPYANKEYKASSTGPHPSNDYETFTPAPAVSGPMYYPSTGNVDFFGYYPYNSSNITTDATGNPIYKITGVDSQDNGMIADFLYAPLTTEGYNKNSSGAVLLDFTHKLAELIITVTYTNGLGDNPEDNTTVSLSKAYYNKADFNLHTGAFLNEAGGNSVNLLKDGGDYRAYLIPQDIAGNGTMKWTFTVNGTDYTFDPYNTTLSGGVDTNFTKLESGKKYRFEIEVTRYQVRSLKAKVVPWVEAGTGTGTAE